MGGGGGKGELGNTEVSIVYSIRIGGEELCLGEITTSCFIQLVYLNCAPSPLLYQT